MREKNKNWNTVKKKTFLWTLSFFKLLKFPDTDGLSVIFLPSKKILF